MSKNQIPKNSSKSNTSTIDKLEAYLKERNVFFRYFIPGISLLFSFLLFDIKISIGHDDALYIMAANNYAKDFFGYYYVDNAPLYVMFLALPIKLFGINLILLKLLSVLFTVVSVFLLYKAFENRIPYVVFIPALLIFSTNWFALTFASLTYTEPFFLLFQGIFIMVLYALIERNLVKTILLKEQWLHILLLGLLMYLLFFTRTVGLGTFIAVAVFFLFIRRPRVSLYTTAAFAAFYGLFEALKRGLWGDKVSQFSQTNILYLKDAYDPSKGTEDLSGFITRFFENSVIYLSGRFWEILGFKEENSEFSGPLTILTVFLILLGLYQALKNKQYYISSATLYFSALLSITFIALQTSWGQTRLVYVYLPMMMITIFYGLYTIFFNPKNKSFSFFYILAVAIIFFVNFKTTLGKVSKNLPIVEKNFFKGDKYAGYTDDYKNFLMLSEYCHDSLPKGSLVISRKAPMSFVYGEGMDFFPVYKANGPRDADSLLMLLKKNKVTHVIFANLRLNPKISGDVYSTPNPQLPPIFLAYQDSDKKAIVNSVHNFMAPAAEKYPEKFELVKIMGEDEEAILYKINY